MSLCSPEDYDCWMRTCNQQSEYSDECMAYFLSLPPASTATNRNRRDFAVSRCTSLEDQSRRECRVLCRDSPGTCRALRMNLCSGVTVGDVEAGSEVARICACYLPREQQERNLERVISNLTASGVQSNAAESLRSQLQFPICYDGNCASSGYGNDTEAILCPDVQVCLQTIVADDGVTGTLVNNCVLGGGVPLPSPEIVVTSVPWFTWMILVLVVLLIVVLLWLVLRRVEKPRPLVIPVPVVSND